MQRLRRLNATTSLAGEVGRALRANGVSNKGSAVGIDIVATGSYLLRMRAVGIKTLKNKLSEYIRAVAAGQTVLVTDRGRVVAEIVPPGSGRNTFTDNARLAEAVRQGCITPPAVITTEPPPRKPVMSFDELMREIEDDRADR